jgi:NAD-dependent dihydropyrimidine dehydrogenase PreA subunit
MSLRKIVQIDEELCDGCGQCVTACAEGAIQIVDGKARLLRDDYCDGLGACLGDCPQGAIRIIERESADFDEEAVRRHLASRQGLHGTGDAVDHAAPVSPTSTRGATLPISHSCPGSRVVSFQARPAAPAGSAAAMPGSPADPLSGAAASTQQPSELRQWPIQLHLLPPTAPYLRGADLLLAADCAAFSCGDFHSRYLKDHALAIACPKLDDPSGYIEKLSRMITEGGIRSITVLMMQVPCCRGLEQMVRMAIDTAGAEVPLRRIILSLEGEAILDQQ